MTSLSCYVQQLSKSLLRVLDFFIQGYQLTVSRWLGPRCRFYPSCSEYARQSLQKHGLGKGILKTTGRLCRCHPFHPGGVDFP